MGRLASRVGAARNVAATARRGFGVGAHPVSEPVRGQF